METDESEPKMNKTKSAISSPIRVKSELTKRKSFNVNDAVRALDLALGRLKKSKLDDGEFVTATNMTPTSANRGQIDMFMDVCSSNMSYATSSSMMSMNFSNYELVRNLSSSNCNSDGAFSSSTCNGPLSPTDNVIKHEHLERFFRSAEMWSQKYRGGPQSSNLNLNLPSK